MQQPGNNEVTLMMKFNSSVAAWDTSLFESLLNKLAENGIVDKVSYVQGSYEVKPSATQGLDVHQPGKLLQLIQQANDGTVYLLFGNDQWEILWNTYPYNEKYGRIEGINAFFLTINVSAGEMTALSEKLAAIFESSCEPGLIEYGIVHDYKNWQEDDTVPVTIGPLFRSVCWTNFLGKAHLKEFNIEALKEMPFYKFKWYAGDTGLYFQLSATLAEVAATEWTIPKEKLTEEFRHALKENSKWK
jgi:hypothetical protein